MIKNAKLNKKCCAEQFFWSLHDISHEWSKNSEVLKFVFILFRYILFLKFILLSVVKYDFSTLKLTSGSLCTFWSWYCRLKDCFTADKVNLNFSFCEDWLNISGQEKLFNASADFKLYQESWKDCFNWVISLYQENLEYFLQHFFNLSWFSHITQCFW